jgi:hypothetical protein
MRFESALVDDKANMDSPFKKITLVLITIECIVYSKPYHLDTLAYSEYGMPNYLASVASQASSSKFRKKTGCSL